MLNVMSTAGAIILAVGYLLPLIYFLWSLKYAKEAGPQPLGGDGPGVEHDLAAAAGQLRGDARS